MIDTEKELYNNATWFKQYELDQEQFTKLIEEKFKRASRYYNALGERESRVVEFD